MGDNTTPPKKCTKCKQEKPLTREFFALHKRTSDGWDGQCKDCKAEYSRQRYQNRPEIRAREREYRVKNKKQRHQYYLTYSLKEEFKTKKREYQRKYQSNPAVRERHRANDQNYRARRLALPEAFSGHDWKHCIEYWHGCCATCGTQLRDLFGNIEPHADHWIPLSYKGSDNPGSVPENMICLCNSCNHSKKNTMPETWLIKRFGKRKAAEILKRIEVYFTWIRQQS